jgi:hypothetical protein
MMRTFAKITAVLVCGYGLFGKTFAYIGVPPAKLFIGDIVLAAFIVLCTRAIVSPMLDGLLRPGQFSALYWGMILFMAYGLIEVARGLALDYSPLPAFQELVVNIYPLYFFVGLWAALIYPDIIPKTIKFISWACVFYAIAYYVVLRNVRLTMPGSDVSMFPGPSAGLALFGITYFENEIRRWWIPIGSSLLIVIASQIRAEWLCLGAALTLQSVLTGKVRRLVTSVVFIAAVLAVGLVTDVSIPSPEGRGVRFVSAREIVARGVAAVDKDAAYDYSRKNAAFYAGTVSWRQRWWKAIWPSVHVDAETALLGHGYGFPLSGLVPYLRGLDIRTPHNIFFYALGYTGWIGVVILFTFQGIVGFTMFRVWQVTGQPFGIVFWLSAMLGAFFGDFFEAPQSAIPYYLTIGMVAADLILDRSRGTVSASSRASIPVNSRSTRLVPAFATPSRVWR